MEETITQLRLLDYGIQDWVAPWKSGNKLMSKFPAACLKVNEG